MKDDFELPCGPTVWAVLLLAVGVVAILDSPTSPSEAMESMEAYGASLEGEVIVLGEPLNEGDISRVRALADMVWRSRPEYRHDAVLTVQQRH